MADPERAAHAQRHDRIAPSVAGARDRAAAGRGHAADPAPDGALEIRDAVGVELTAGATLLAASLGFEPRDAIPAWLMQTTVDHGGLALGAFRDGQLAGFSYALPCGDWELFSCGLAVAPAWRGHGVGRRLKCAQRDRALRRRAVADPLDRGPAVRAGAHAVPGRPRGAAGRLRGGALRGRPPVSDPAGRRLDRLAAGRRAARPDAARAARRDPARSGGARRSGPARLAHAGAAIDAARARVRRDRDRHGRRSCRAALLGPLRAARRMTAAGLDHHRRRRRGGAARRRPRLRAPAVEPLGAHVRHHPRSAADPRRARRARCDRDVLRPGRDGPSATPTRSSALAARGTRSAITAIRIALRTRSSPTPSVRRSRDGLAALEAADRRPSGRLSRAVLGAHAA